MTDWDFKQLLVGAAAGRQAQKRQGHADRQQAYQEGYRDGNHAKLGGTSGGLTRALDLCTQAGFAAASYALAVCLEKIVQDLPSSARAEFAKAYLAVPDQMAKTSAEKALGFPRKRFEAGDYTLLVHDGDSADRLASGTWDRLERILAEAARTPAQVPGASLGTGSTASPDGLAAAHRANLEKRLDTAHLELGRVRRAAAERERSLEADILAQRGAAEAEKQALRERFLQAGRRIGAGDAVIRLLENLPRSAKLSIAESCLDDADSATDLIDALIPSAGETQITPDRDEIGDDALEQEISTQESRVRNIFFNAVKDELAEAGNREDELVGLLSLVRLAEPEPPSAAGE